VQAVLTTWTCGVAGDRVSKGHVARAVGDAALHDTVVATGILTTNHAMGVFEALVAMATESVAQDDRLASGWCVATA
jgi:hypothetical protein